MIRFFKKCIMIILGIIASLFLIVFGFVVYDMMKTPTSIPVSSPDTEKLDVKYTHELKLYDTESSNIVVDLKHTAYHTFMKNLENINVTFDMAPYYDIENTLQMYKNNKNNHVPDHTLLDENGLLDANKLYKQVQLNNEAYMTEGSNAVNMFYTDISSADLRMICDLTKEVVNQEYLGVQIEDVASILKHLTVFERTTTPSNAYVSSDLTFVYNPTMIGMYADMQQISQSSSSEEETRKSVIVHEIMHLLQYATGDYQKQNGLEAGFCRMYEDQVSVDSLWYTWLLEAGAELGMADYLNVEPGTYAKKISYVDSFNLSRFHEYKQGLETFSFLGSLEDVYQQLNLKTASQQMEFLQLMYSIELTQASPEDFWENYTAHTNKTPSESEQTEIRMAIREEVVQYLTKSFYKNLIQSIKDKKVIDLNSIFYLMRIWELDCFKHLEYTQATSLEYAKEFIRDQHTLQNYMFEAIASSTNLTKDEVSQAYDNYHMHLQIDDTIKDHCDFSRYSSTIEDFLLSMKNNYTSTRFSRNNDMYQYIQE